MFLVWLISYLALSAVFALGWCLAGRAGVFDDPPAPPRLRDDGFPESDGDEEGAYGDLR